MAVKSKLYSMTPKEIVAELDKYIIGQEEAKKSVAIALRNRYRRSLLSEEMREEIGVITEEEFVRIKAANAVFYKASDENCTKI